jgi:hypothetical protein
VAKAKKAASRCASPDCGREVAYRGYCLSHYRRLLRGEDPNAPLQERGKLYPLPVIPRVPIWAAGDIFDECASRDISAYRLVREILEAWAVKRREEMGIAVPEDDTPVEPPKRQPRRKANGDGTTPA